MCGIAGIFEFKEKRIIESPGTCLGVMLDCLHHRGPDARGEQTLSDPSGNRLFLGHQRLSIIDLSEKANQPMPNDDRTVWISTNSEIYNFRELRQELESGYRFKSQSDTEVLLRAYEAWDTACLDKLRGMFAFAIWDSRRGRLFLARDRLGIKPLYYHRSDAGFVFSSEVRALRASGIPKTGMSDTGLYHYLTFGRLQSPQSILEDVQELPPAHYLLIDQNKFELNRYWNPLESSGERVEHPNKINGVLKEASGLHLISDMPLGAFLSGGIDSSAVVSLVSESSPVAPKTLSVVFDEKQYDESGFSQRVADQFKTEHHALKLSAQDLLALIPHAVDAMDQPTMDGINTFIISKSAREMGLSVALSGLGGDELFAGYESFQLLPRIIRAGKISGYFPGFMRKLAEEAMRSLLPSSDWNTKARHLLKSKTSGAHPYFLLRALFCEDDVELLFKDKSVFNKERQKEFERTKILIERIKPLGLTEQISYLELTEYMANMLLRDTDMMSMAHSLEIRVPLLDHLLVELMFKIPDRLKMAPGKPKPLLVNALPEKLPPEIVYRKKMGFTLPFETWMREDLKKEMESVLLSPVPPLSNYISESEVARVWTDFLNHRVSWARPWAIYTLKKWADRNLQ